MEIDSKPEKMDRLDRRLIQLKIEREALKKDTDEATLKRLEALEREIKDLEREYSDLEEVWKSEKAAVHGVQQLKEALDRARLGSKPLGDLGLHHDHDGADAGELGEQMQQGHRASAARHGDQYAAARREQPLSTHRHEHTLGEWVHGSGKMVPVQGLEPRTPRI